MVKRVLAPHGLLLVLPLLVAALALGFLLHRAPGPRAAGAISQRNAPHRRTAHPALAMPADGPYLHTDGAVVRDAAGHAVRLSGINWFGLETCIFAPGGLGVRSWWDLLDQARALGFNAIRLPFSDQLLEPASYPLYINYALNPDLRDLSGLQVMDRIIHGAGERGLRIILDRHRPDCKAQAPLWYTPRYSERRWITDLTRLVGRYRHEPAVIGLDLDNEPHGPATWGTGNLATDWRLAAERAGNAVLRINPHLLIFVQGVQVYHGDNYWWGGNLEGAATAPVRLAVPHRLVYEAHDYGPGVYWQNWFSAPDFPDNLPTVWRRHWAYLEERGIAPVLLGEFGGRSVLSSGTVGATLGQRREGTWQRMLVAYLVHHPEMSFTYWSFTPDSSDTGGLLNYDWQTADIAKESLLRPIQGAAIPQSGALPPPAPLRVLASDVMAPGGNQQNLTIRIVNDGPDPVTLVHAQLRYWLDASRPLSAAITALPASTLPDASVDPAGTGPNGADLVQGRAATVDWASTGANTVATAAGSSDGYAYLTFDVLAPSSTAPILAPYGGSAALIVRLHRVDWAPYAANHDWSYAASEAPIPADHLTLAINGRTVWGISPIEEVAGHLHPAAGHAPTPRPHTAMERVRTSPSLKHG
jgi:endoglucanase